MLCERTPRWQGIAVIAVVFALPYVEAVSLHYRVKKLLEKHQGQPPDDFVPRIALIKQPRSGSSLLFDQLEEAACSRGGTCDSWQREAVCKDSRCLDDIRATTNCTGPDGCGFSLNPFKPFQSSWALAHWAKIVDVLAENPVTVIFLTRQDHFSQAISTYVAALRDLALHKKYPPDSSPCGKDGGYHFEHCPKEVSKEVDESIHVELGVDLINKTMDFLAYVDQDFQHMEQRLRQRNNTNLRILNVTYEELYDGHWDPLFKAVGKPGRTPPVMFDSDYSKQILNLDELKKWSVEQKLTA